MSTDLQRFFRVFGQVFVSSLHSAGKTKRIFMTVLDKNISKKNFMKYLQTFYRHFVFPVKKFGRFALVKSLQIYNLIDISLAL